MNNHSVNHGRLVRNVLRLMDNACAQSLYEVLPRGVGIWIADQSWSIYPDVMVVGGQPLLYSGLTDKVMNPCLLFEVIGDRVEPEVDEPMADPPVEGGPVAQLLANVMEARARIPDLETKGDSPAPDSPAQVSPVGQPAAAIDADSPLDAPSDPQPEPALTSNMDPDADPEADDPDGDFPPTPSTGVLSFDPHQPPADAFAYARLIPYLQEYVRISRHRLHVEQYHRVGEYDWELIPHTNADSVIELNVTNARLPLSDIYHQVDFSLLL